MTNVSINTTNTNTGMEELTMIKKLEVAIINARESKVPAAFINNAKKILTKVSSGHLGQEAADKAIAMLDAGLNPNAVVENYKQFKSYVKLIKTKDYVRFISLILNRDPMSSCPEGLVTSAPQSVGRATSFVSREDEAIVPVGFNLTKKVTKNDFAPFSKDMISIKFKSSEDLEIAKTEGFYVIHAGADTKAYLPKGSTDDITPDTPFIVQYEDICTGDIFSKEEIVELTEHFDGDLRMYKCFVFSPSDVRNMSYLAMDVTVEDRREEMLDKVSNGAWTKAKEHLDGLTSGKRTKKNGEAYTEKEIELWILKTMPRFGQFKAGSINLGKIKCWAEYKGIFSTSSGETVDGSAYQDAVMFAEYLSDLLGITVSPEAVIGLFIQGRPDTHKAGIEIVDKEVMHEMIKKLIETEGEECIVIHGGTLEEVTYFADQNIIKANSNYVETGIDFELLEIATCSPANTSIQALMKPLFNDQKGTEKYIEQIMTENTVKKVTDTFLNKVPSIPTPGDAMKAYVVDMVSCMDPTMILRDPSLKKNATTSFVNSALNAANKLKYAVDGNNVRLTSDISEMIVGKKGREYSVIPYGKVYMPAATRYFMKKARTEVMSEIDTTSITKEELRAAIIAKYNSLDKRVCMIKYPSMGINEYYLAEVMDYKDVVATVNAMNVDENTKRLIKKHYKTIGETLAILPALDIVMFQCAGLDYDYDGATFIYDERFIKLLSDKIEATKYLNSQE